MTGQELLNWILNCAERVYVFDKHVRKREQIEGGLLLTMADDSKWQLEATLLGGREDIKQEPEKPKCFGEWYPGSMICIRIVECDVWQECITIWKKKQESEGRV